MANKLYLDNSGGMNAQDSPLVIKDNESELIINYNLDKQGALTRRNGYEKFATNSLFYTSGFFGTMNPNNKAGIAYVTTNDGTFETATKRITYYYKSADNAWMATDDNAQKPYKPTTGAADEVFKTRFVSALNYIFRFNGGDAPKSFLITTPQTATTTNLVYEDASAISMTPYLGVVYQDRMYINDSANGKRSRLYYSTEITAGGTITWGANSSNQQYFDVNVDDGDFITALENNGNHLLIFKNHALYRWTWGQLEPDRIIGVGTISQESVKTDFERNTTYFANKKGVYAYQGGVVKNISRKIQPYIEAVTDVNWIQCAGGIDRDHYYLSVGDITVNSRTITNAMFVYHINLNAWTIYSLAERPTVFTEVGIGYPARTLMFGTANGQTYQFSTSTSDILGGVAKTISSEVITKERMLTFPEKTILENIDVIAIQGGDTKVSYQLDRNLIGREGDFVSLKGGLQKRVNTFRVGKEMHTIRLRLTDNSSRASIIEGYNLEYNPKKDR